ncbi:mannose-1-phosphate guanylyltransferase [Gephyromycinifex aptenodytis]|uniref:mannose-1-phosphate guanylyltransferase n=1 Tax=Gephyromycinifex aptenodytis TaxID=2716227 RepID=UPI001444D4A3|nr:mannose-1-phosphate guanylyltransferase [Gephyromycinifex aptenodytis]
MQASTLEHFWAVIPAGGAGTRLWPLSRAGAPKFLLDLVGRGRTLLQSTADRLEPLCGQNLVVVTGAAHVEAVRAQLPQVADGRLLAEPAPRDSMAAIGWAAAVIERLDPEAIIGSFAADHVVGAEDDFREAVAEAVAVAQQDRVVTIGIRPTHAATGFGYIHEAGRLGLAQAPHAYEVSEFVEKPDEATARSYLETGHYRWNAGMFVVKARVLLDVLHRYHPQLATQLRAIAAQPEELPTRWPNLEKIAIDHAVAEPAAADGQVAVVRGDFPWDDVGDFDSLADVLPSDSYVETDSGRGISVLGDASQVLGIDSGGVVVPGSKRLVAVLGLDDVVIVDTSDALLVTTRSAAQRVKSIVTQLKDSGQADLT